MTLSALLRHLAFAVGLALLSAIVVRLMIAARVLDRPDPRKVPRAGDTKGRRGRCGRGVPGRHCDPVSLCRVRSIGGPLFRRRHRGVGRDRHRRIPGRSVRLEVFREVVSADPGSGGCGGPAASTWRTINIPYAGPLSHRLAWRRWRPFLWLLFATNALNFIDGLNGLAAGVALIAGSFLAGIAAAHDGFFAYFASLLLIAGLAGFLPFNFPRARIFMGDVGSQFCGFILAAILAVVASRFDNVELSFLIVPMLLSGVLFDVAFTPGPSDEWPVNA